MSGLRDDQGLEGVRGDSEPDAGKTGNCVCTLKILAPQTLWTLGPWATGIVLGLLLPTSKSLPPPVDTVSAIIGWVYFSAWSISFYPQLHSNFVRRSVVGLSLDFQIINMLGFMCYAAYNAALFWSRDVRKEYARAHSGRMPAVHANDVFFSLHAAFITMLILVQCILYERQGHKPSKASILSVSAVVVVSIAWCMMIIASRSAGIAVNRPVNSLPWLPLLYFLSLIKLGVSIVKYIPQVLLNYKRQSTVGWNIWNVLLDFEGGILSVAQIVIDAVVCSDWSPIVGNPAKFALGCSSMAFDVIFMVQHYVLYDDQQDDSALDGLGNSGAELLLEGEDL